LGECRRQNDNGCEQSNDRQASDRTANSIHVIFLDKVTSGSIAQGPRENGPEWSASRTLFAASGRPASGFPRNVGRVVVDALSGVASIVTLSYVVLSQVLRAGPVNKHRITVAIAVYLLRMQNSRHK